MVELYKDVFNFHVCVVVTLISSLRDQRPTRIERPVSRFTFRHHRVGLEMDGTEIRFRTFFGLGAGKLPCEAYSSRHVETCSFGTRGTRPKSSIFTLTSGKLRDKLPSALMLCERNGNKMWRGRKGERNIICFFLFFRKWNESVIFIFNMYFF